MNRSARWCFVVLMSCGLIMQCSSSAQAAKTLRLKYKTGDVFKIEVKQEQKQKICRDGTDAGDSHRFDDEHDLEH